MGEDEGLTSLYMLMSDCDDWDHYETLQWWAIDEYVRAHPDDPDINELVSRKTREKNHYLQRGRVTMGWAVCVFKKRSLAWRKGIRFYSPLERTIM